MKKYIIIPVLLLFSSGIFGQGIYNNGSKIVVGSGVTLTASGSGGNYRNESNGSLDLSGTLKLEGNLTNNAVSDFIDTSGAGSKVELNGSSLQTIGGSSTAIVTFPDLTITNSGGGVVLAKEARVNGTLTLTSGLLSIGANNLILSSATTVAGTPSASSMVVASGVGQLRKEYSANGSFTFPVGDNTGIDEYSPVTLSFTSGTFAPGAFTGLSLANSAYVPSATLSRYWTIDQAGITGFTGNAVFQYVPADIIGTEANMVCVRVDPIPATVFGTANVGLHQLSATGLNSFGTFSGGNALVAPVADNNQSICYNTSPIDLLASAASGGSESFTYQWQISSDNLNWSDIDGATSLDYAPGLLTLNTYYRIVATDSIWGSVKSNVVTIIVNPILTVEVEILESANNVCEGTWVTFIATPTNGGTTPVYQWKVNGSNVGTDNPVYSFTPDNGDYITCELTSNASPCASGSPATSNIITMTVNPLPAAIAGADRSICLNGSTTLGATAVVGNTYSWTSTPGGFTSTEANPLVSPTLTTTYTVTENTTLTGCSNTNSVVVTVNPLPAAIDGADRTICANSATTLGTTAVAGSTYSWTSIPAGFTSTQANPSVNPTTTTAYTVTETTTLTGCSNSNSVLVTVNPLPAANAGADRSICLNGLTILGAATVAGSTYSWTSTPAGYTSAQHDPLVNPDATTTYTLTETTTLTGCSNTNSVVVTVNPLPNAIAGADRSICANSGTTLGTTAVAGSIYSWTSTPAGFTSTQANPLVNPTVTTTYTVTETTILNGCSNTNSVVVTVNPLPAAIAGADRSICLNGSTTLGATAVVGNTYSWTSTPGGFTSTEANPLVSPTVTTTYTVTETTTHTGCSNTNSVVVTVNRIHPTVHIFSF